MSIATEIERLQNAKFSIKAAIENKGIEVGDGLIDTYATKISEIPYFEINNCAYLFIEGARLEYLEEFLKACKNVTNLERMFASCSSLTSVDLSSLDTGQITEMSYMFYNCSALTSIDLSNLDTSQVTSLTYIFSGCSSVTSIDISSFDMSKVTSLSNVFTGTSRLTNLKFGYDLGKGYIRKTNNLAAYRLTLVGSLTHESLMDVINKLYDLNLTYDVANGGTLKTQQLVLGADNLAKLTSDELSIATNKGWVVS